MSEPVKLPSLPLGKVKFEDIRKSGRLYVDKTALIYNLITSSNNYIALSAPRRFGKSLTVSTIASIFEHGVQFCEGLAIEKLWTDKSYPTIRLDFSNFDLTNDFEDFKSTFRSKLSLFFSQYGFKAPDNQGDFYVYLEFWMQHLPEESLVLLIDEYDSPLTQVVDNHELFKAVQAELSTFYSTLKINNDCLRFLLITGVTRYSHTGIYSGPNFITDVTLDPRYASLLGFTQEELEFYFAGHIEQTAAQMKLSKDELLTKIKNYYDGFCFDRDAKVHVYNPWSVVSFFQARNFENFWYQSGGNTSILLSKLFAKKFSQIEDFVKPSQLSLDELKASVEYELTEPNVILFDTGYLTITKALPGGALELNYPNFEVKESLARLLVRVMTNYQTKPIAKTLYSLLQTKEIARLIEYLNSVVAALDYQNYAIRDEASFQALLQVLMIGNGLNPLVEHHQATGRTDIELALDELYYVFELKYANEETNPESKIAEAVKQIKDKRYGAPVYGKTLKRIALVFSDKTKTIHYQEVTSDDLASGSPKIKLFGPL